jgi:transposase InsO family protein
MREIHKMLGIKTSISTVYHPQSNGQTERINQEVEAYIHHFISHRQDDWSDLLATVEFVLNNRKQLATDSSPFKLNYSFSPNMDLTATPAKTPGAENYIANLKDVKSTLSLAHQNRN